MTQLRHRHRRRLMGLGQDRPRRWGARLAVGGCPLRDRRDNLKIQSKTIFFFVPKAASRPISSFVPLAYVGPRLLLVSLDS